MVAASLPQKTQAVGFVRQLNASASWIKKRRIGSPFPGLNAPGEGGGIVQVLGGDLAIEGLLVGPPHGRHASLPEYNGSSKGRAVVYYGSR